MQKERKTILIPGGAGFIGSHLVEKYLGEGHRVIVIDNLQTTWKPKNISRFFSDPNFRFIRADIIDPLERHLKNEEVDWIINCACAGSYTSYQFNPVHTVKTNTVGMINLLEIARSHGARILQTSTSEIYGDPLESPQKESYLGNVNSLGPRACYDEGKRVAETLCMDYHREYSLDVKIIRIFNTYGPNMDPNDGRAITNFVRNALVGKDLPIYGDGKQTRSFMYIDDLVRGIDRMLRTDGLVGPVNLGNPGEVTMEDLAKKIIAMTGSSSKLVYVDEATDDPRRRCPDITIARRELGWEPSVPLEDGLKKTIDYFLRVEWPEKKVLVFATTYYPDLGPAEEALFELSKLMPDTEFHIVTTKFRKGIPEIEEVGTDTIHRVGPGGWMDKFLLPFLGYLKAQKLKQKHDYRFVWSVMGSYSGMAALLFKLANRETNLLITLDDKELRRKGWKAKILSPIYHFVLGGSDSIYVSNIALAEGSQLLGDARVTQHEGDIKAMVNKVRFTYADLANKQEKKLHRPK
jgi:UDP-glucuronate decarboxylase